MTHRVVRRGRGVLLLGLGLAAVLCATGCTPAASGDSSVAPAPSASGTAGSPGESEDLTPGTGLRDEHRVEWSRSEVVGDHQVRVHFLLRDPRCYGARADVRTTSEAVEITVLEGSLPGAPASCTLDASEASLLVTTDSPIGGRPVTQP